jgi:AraC family transcriptional regulator, transcriptional activator of pobA
MTNPNNLKQNVPFEEQLFPFTSIYVQPLEKQILHLHWHDEWEIIYITKGEGIFHIGSEKVSAKRGDILFVNRGLIHTGFSKGDYLIEYYAIIFHPNLVGNFMSDTNDFDVINRYKSGKYLFPTHIKAEDSYYGLFIDVIKKIIDEYEQQSNGFQVVIRSLLQLIIVQYSRYYPIISEAFQSSGYDEDIDAKFKQLFSYIEEHYDDKITLDDVANIVNLSTYHFCRTFKKITGKTFIEYLNLYRINVAETKLLETNDPVTQIAYDVGFGSINYFSQMFKQYKLVSPSQYRKKD